MRDKLTKVIKTSKTAALMAKSVTAKANEALPESRANEVRLTALGGLAGSVGGATLIGGMGLAALGTAVPLAGFAVVGAACAIVGNKIGSEIDRRKLAKNSLKADIQIKADRPSDKQD